MDRDRDGEGRRRGRESGCEDSADPSAECDVGGGRAGPQEGVLLDVLLGVRVALGRPLLPAATGSDVSTERVLRGSGHAARVPTPASVEHYSY